MNFVADENLDKQIVERLRQDGHTVWHVAEMEPGISDDVVLELANREVALLLTADKDFGELVFRLRRVALVLYLFDYRGYLQLVRQRLFLVRSRNILKSC